MATKRIELKYSEVIFNAEDHTYLLGEKYLSGITSVLQRQLFPDEFEGIPKHIVDAAAEYGTDVHASCENFDSNWINDGTVELQDYIQLCREYGLTHEASEYLVSNEEYASQIDKVYRVSEDCFDLADIKTYGQMTSQKLEKARWQLSIYASMFEKQNKKAKVGRLFIIHLRNKQKKDGSFNHVSNIIFANRIPSDICEELLATDLRGEQFINPFDIPEEYRSQEDTIRELIQKKAEIEEELNGIKTKILQDMESMNIRLWATPTMRLTRKPPTERLSFDVSRFKLEHPEDYESYIKVSQVSGSLQIAI